MERGGCGKGDNGGRVGGRVYHNIIILATHWLLAYPKRGAWITKYATALQ